MHAPDTTPPTRSPWLRRVLIGLVVLAGVYLGTVFALSRFLDPARLADWIQPRLAAAANRDVEIAAADVRLIPFEVRLTDVEVADPTGLAPSLARVGSVGLRVRLLPLLRREVRVDRISVVDPVVALRVGADGTSNFGDLSPESGEAPESEGVERPLSLDLRRIEVEGGSLGYVSVPDSLDLTLSDLSATSSVRRDAEGPWLFEGESGADVTVMRGGRPLVLDSTLVELSFDVETGPEFQDMSIRNGALSVEGVAFALAGDVSDLKEPVRRIALSATLRDLPIERVVEALPDSLRARLGGDAAGVLSADLSIQGELGPDVRPEVTGTATLAGGRIEGRNGVTLAEALDGRVVLSAGGGVEPRLSGTVLGGAASVEGRATLGEEGRVDLLVRAAPDLARLGSVVRLPEGVTLGGRMSADVRVTGPLGGLDGLALDGTLEAQGIRATHPELGVPVEIPTGQVRLSGTRASFEELPIVLGPDRLVATGEMRDLMAFADPASTPYVSAAVQGEHLSLLALRATPPADTALTYGRVAFARVGGRSVGGHSPEDAAREMGLERPDSIPLAGTLDVSLDRLEDRRGVSEDVWARVEFGPRFLRVTEATFRRYGGELSAGFDLTLGATADEPFTLRFRAVDVDAGSFLSATTPLGNLVRGTVSVELDVTGGLDALLLPTRSSLVGTGRFVVRGGGLNATPVTERIASFLGMEALRTPDIRDWDSGFVLENGIVRLADAVMNGTPGTPHVGGGIGLDGALSLLAAFDIPVERLDSATLARLGVAGEVAERLRQREDVVQAVLRIGGNVSNPALEADAGSPVRTLATAVQEEAAAEVREQVEERRKELEDRASGFLRGLFQRRDTAGAAPADTARADTLRADTLARDSVPPDTVRPDTVRPDTVRPDTMRPDTGRADTLRPDTSVTDSPVRTRSPRPGTPP